MEGPTRHQGLSLRSAPPNQPSRPHPLESRAVRATEARARVSLQLTAASTQAAPLMQRAQPIVSFMISLQGFR
jgi:hypothetical protein